MKKDIIGQDEVVNEIDRVINIFKVSEGEIRPHFILTGESGSSKTFTIANLAEEHNLGYIEVNAAQLTKEGTSGNSLSKALSPLASSGGKPTIVFVDEFDKLFISGNSNDSAAHESTTGVQNEFLKVLESDTATVYGDYGKYISIPIKNCLFVFAGAFNGEANITIDRLREIGLKTEFLGRVGLVYNTKRLTLKHLYQILDGSPLFSKYINLFDSVDSEKAIYQIKAYLQANYDMNTLGARMINTLVHQYFIKGGKLNETESKNITFQKKLTL
jgi:ATP-dependent protease Clp ATPase subunit